MSSPPPNEEPCKKGIKREDWDKCVRHGTWRVAIGIILGAIGSAFAVSEMPVAVGTGLGIGWAVRHCKSILNKDQAKKKDAQKGQEDPCACCNSEFEALDKDEFACESEPKAPAASPSPSQTPPNETYEEEECTCNEIPLNWSPPTPEGDESSDHPIGCSCFR